MCCKNREQKRARRAAKKEAKARIMHQATILAGSIARGYGAPQNEKSALAHVTPQPPYEAARTPTPESGIPKAEPPPYEKIDMHNPPSSDNSPAPRSEPAPYSPHNEPAAHAPYGQSAPHAPHGQHDPLTTFALFLAREPWAAKAQKKFAKKCAKWHMRNCVDNACWCRGGPAPLVNTNVNASPMVAV